MHRAYGIILVVLIVSMLAVPAVSQEKAPSFDVGLSVGLLIMPNVGSLPTMGGGFGVPLVDNMSIRASYWRTGISLLGVSIMTVDVFDLTLMYDMAPKSTIGFYVFGGGAYLLAGVMGQGVGGFALTAGFGVHAQPIKSVHLYAEYCPLIRNEILHVVQIGASFLF